MLSLITERPALIRSRAPSEQYYAQMMCLDLASILLSLLANARTDAFGLIRLETQSYCCQVFHQLKRLQLIAATETSTTTGACLSQLLK